MNNTVRIMILALIAGGAAVEAFQHEVHRRQGDDPAVNMAWSQLTASMNQMHQAMASTLELTAGTLSALAVAWITHL